MAWTTPNYSRREVNRAGETLINPNASLPDLEHAFSVINNWRASHNFPLNTFQIRLRDKAKQVDANSIIAQRIKRLSSIKSKLERIDGLNLVQIQDIGGCRVIVNNISAVNKLVDIYQNQASRGLKHSLFSIDDYIFEKPKTSGYRSVHLVYQYKSDKNKIYNNQKIEIQIRTILQHAWATTVETIDTFTDQTLKTGGGNEKWKRFFALMSSVIAIKEGMPTIPNTSNNIDNLRNEIIFLEKKLKIINSLEAYTATLEYTGDLNYEKGSYFLLELNPTAKSVSIKSFNSKASNKASDAYLELEKNNTDGRKNIVLISADSIGALKLAYPNYYADTDKFISILRGVISSKTQLELFNETDFI